MDRGAWWAAVHGLAEELDTTECLTLSLSEFAKVGARSLLSSRAG